MYNWTRMLMIFPMLVRHMSELVSQAYSRVWLAKNPCRIFICGEKSCIVMIWYVMIAIYTVYRYLQHSAVAKNNDNILSLLHPKNLLGSHRPGSTWSWSLPCRSRDPRRCPWHVAKDLPHRQESGSGGHFRGHAVIKHLIFAVNITGNI